MATSLEILQPQLDEFCSTLSGWRRRGSEQRESRLFRSARIAEDIVYGPQPSHRLVLTIGDEPIDAYTFAKGAYNAYSKHVHQAKPGMGVSLYRTASFIERGARHVYLGGHFLIHITDLASTLDTGGVLEFRPTEEAPKPTFAEMRRDEI